MLLYGITHEKPLRPNELRFHLLSAEDIEAMSACEVTHAALYYRGLPASGGLLDPLMGSVDSRHLCASCMLDVKRCQGHAGHIRLAYPVYHIGFLDTTIRVLRCVCFCCSRVSFLPDEDPESLFAGTSGKTRLNAVHAALRGRKTCPHCGMPRPAYTRVPLGVRVTWPPDTAWESEEERQFCESPFTAREALSVLRSMQDADVRSIGLDPLLSHPQNMILRSMVVPPPCTRPAIYSSEGSRSRGQNELTVRLSEILRRSHDVQTAMEGEGWQGVKITQDLLDRVSRLQYEVIMFINSNVRVQRPPGMGRSSGQTTVKSLTDRLKGKEGRVRGNLMGKRVDFSARCVITPDACFDCDRVGVPYSIAKRLTVPETVNSTNIADLTARVRRGSGSVRGAETILSASGEMRLLAHCEDRDSLTLRFGDVVERYLQDDDAVVFNRQPSLHMHGMQAHRVRLMPGHTFRLSLAVAAPYNADFDGDEMNVHVPQSPLAAVECALLMGVAQNCISAQSNKPVLGVVQDALVALHIMTESATLLDHAQACRLIGATRYAAERACGRLPPPAVAFRPPSCGGGTAPVLLWTGRQIFSLLTPECVTVEPRVLPSPQAREWTSAGDVPVVVRGGALLSGTLSKAQLGTSSGGIVDVVCRDLGGVAGVRFLSDAQRMANQFLMKRAHHVGVHDILLSAEGQQRVSERLRKAMRICEELESERAADARASDTTEGAILRILSKTLLQTGSIVHEHMSRTNAIRRMVTAGSKGSFINLSQICACLGQQSLEGARITSDALPCFSRDDTSLAAQGMVVNSFALGLSPSELFYHGIGGREGLVDTAVKTSQTGYLQRRINKSMEDHVVQEDGTVRDARRNVVSFQWGSDGLDPVWLERVHAPLLLGPATREEARLDAEEWDLLVAFRRAVLRSKTGVLATDFDARVHLPFHPARVARDAGRSPAPDASNPSLCAEEARTRVRALLARSPPAVGIAVLGLASAERLARLRVEPARALLARLESAVSSATATRGKSVGCIAAQSVGQPATQMTLNTFHLAGCATKNVTLGVPRLKELVDVSRTTRTPCTTIRFAGHSSTGTVASYFAATLPLLRLSDVVSRVDILPRGRESADELWVDSVHARVTGAPSGSGGKARLFVRLSLAQDVMRAGAITPPIVRDILAERLAGRATVRSSETNMIEWSVRIYIDCDGMLAHGELEPDQEEFLVQRAADMLLDAVVVGGHVGVISATAQTSPRFDPVTGAQREEHVVHAYGSVLADCAMSDCIDWERCITNDVWETYSVLGVEACAHLLFDQIRVVVSFDGTYVDDRHIMLIVDTICRSGGLMPLNRHGINRADTSPLMRASFEETTDILCDAAVFAESENAEGVSTSVMAGQLARMGTGRVDVLVPSLSAPGTLKFPKPAGRVMRSTCRSFKTKEREDVVEYLPDDSPLPMPARSLSPPDERMCKRMRFRNMSPEREA